MEDWSSYHQLQRSSNLPSQRRALSHAEMGYHYNTNHPVSLPTSFRQPALYVPHTFPQTFASEIDSYAYLRNASLPLNLQQLQTLHGYSWQENRSEYVSTPTLSSAGRSLSPDEMRFHYSETMSPEPMIFDEPLRSIPTFETASSTSTLETVSSTSTYETASSISTPVDDTNAPPTEIDALMRAIQAKSSKTPTSAITSHPSDPSTSLSQKPKKHLCPYPSCLKSFTQKTHLDIHLRSHSGEKPFLCREPSCGQRFSQLGNLRTHERRHTGEKPFACEIEGCGKKFAQRGNLRGHRLGVHGLGANATEHDGSSCDRVTGRGKGGRGRFECRLDDCGTNGEGKWFTQLGNLKSHQNKFHKSTLRELRERFARLVVEGGEGFEELMGTEERRLWQYFESLYRNCNKGR